MKKTLRTLLLVSGLALMTGYAAHLGGCDMKKARSYYRALSARLGQAKEMSEEGYDKLQEGYKTAQRIKNQVEEYLESKKPKKSQEDPKDKKKKDSQEKVNV